MQPCRDAVLPLVAWSVDGERGATAIEYGLLLAVIAAVIAASVTLLGGEVKVLYESAKWW
jgi:Flp pilus assembly pilin Flp